MATARDTPGLDRQRWVTPAARYPGPLAAVSGVLAGLPAADLDDHWPTIGFAACALISFGLLTLALHGLEVGPAYAVWTGIGAVGTAVVGMAALGGSVSALKLVSIGLVLAGVAGLNLSGVTP